MLELRTSSFLGTLFLISAIPLLNAQVPAWDRINPIPVESSFTDIELLPNGRVIASGSDATIMYSDNMGEDWNIVYTPDDISKEVFFNGLDFADDLHGIAVGSYFSIIRTDDGGETWTDISPGANLPYFAYYDVCFRDLSNCFIVGQKWNRFVLHSSDGGTSWDTVFQTSDDTFNQVFFVDGITGFLGVTGGDYFFKSSDGGESWDRTTVVPAIDGLNIGVLHFITKDIGFIGAAVHDGLNWDNIILKTVDGGQSWYQVFFDYFASAHDFFFLDQSLGFAISPTINYTNQVLKTTDGGESWEFVTDHLGHWSIESLCMNGEGNGLIVGEIGQIFKSDDFGNTWESAFINEFLAFTICKAFIINDSVIVADMYGGGGGAPNSVVIESSDRGATWAESQNYPSIISDIHFIDDSIAFFCGAFGGIYKSVDGGNSWTFHELTTEPFQPLSIDFFDDQTGFVGGSVDDAWIHLYKTDDQGETWTRVNSDAFSGVSLFYQLDFKDDSTGFIVGEIGYDTNSIILASYDRGTTWEKDTLPFLHDFTGILFLNPDIGFLYGNNKLCKTINGGQNWYPVTYNPQDYLEVNSMCFPSSETGYFANISGSNQSIFKTIDGGETWISLDPPTSSDILSINFFTEDEGVIVGENAIIFKTLTGGIVGLPDPVIKPLQESKWRCHPNPFSNHVNIISTEDFQGDIFIRIFDCMGRSARHHSGSSAISGQPFFDWDGTDDYGNPVSPGIYFICINYNSSEETLKIVKF